MYVGADGAEPGAIPTVDGRHVKVGDDHGWTERNHGRQGGR